MATTTQFTAAHSWADSLRQLQQSGARATVHLGTGCSFTGRIADVSEHAVIIAGLAQKDFFDALVSLPAIVAVEAQARTS